MMKKKTIILASVCCTLLVVAVYGIYLESQLHNKFNGSYVHILVAPVLSMFLGLFSILVWGRYKTFLKNFLLGWFVTTIAYLLILLLHIRHYGYGWQPEWYLFWGIISAIVFLIVWFTDRVIKKP